MMVQFKLNQSVCAQLWFNMREFGAKKACIAKDSEMYAKKGGIDPPKDRNRSFYAADCLAVLCAIHDRVVSSMRLEKPHSLSYQERTFVSPPRTLV